MNFSRLWMRLLSVILFAFLMQNSKSLYAQICDGNLGENIFTEGDFGSGTQNVLQVDPQIAPGYIYNTNPPFGDGFYTISNNTGNWSNNFMTWLDIPDNSSDPNGYMMIVNASFEPGLFYEQEVEGLCENTLYEFSADVINLIRTNVSNHIAPNVSFSIDGVQQYTTGDIPQNESWNSYGFTFTTAPGQTTVVLSLNNNAPGGIGNDLALDNISFQPCGPLAQILPENIESICEDGQPISIEATVTGDQYDNPAFQWQQSFDEGMTWVDIPGENGTSFLHSDLSSGFYYYRYLLAAGSANLQNSKCRVVSNIKIIEVVPKFWSIIDTLCDGLVYTTGTSSYTQTGVYIDSLTSSIGCDSIVTLDLTFIPDQGIMAEISVVNPPCFGEDAGSIIVDSVSNAYLPFTFSLNGNAVTTFENLSAGNYTFGITDNYGCTFETMVDISDPASFTIEVGPDQTVELGTEVTIDPISSAAIENYSWSPEVAECEPACFDLSFVPTNSALYILEAQNANGCISTDSIFINVEKIRRVFIPNIFSPNFDGFNDYFAPLVGQPNVQAIPSIKVFNRWGGLVYEAENIPLDNFSSGWDGTVKNNKEAQTGVYVYLIQVLFLDGDIITYSGDVLLIR